MTRVLFVCLGNICRSAMAEGVFKAKAETSGLDAHIASAGTSTWHIGEAPDPRAQEMALSRGIDISDQRGHQMSAEEFADYDYIIAMDASNLAKLRALGPARDHHKIHMMLNFADGINETDVPDPYYGGPDGFEDVMDMIEAASDGLIAHIQAKS